MKTKLLIFVLYLIACYGLMMPTTITAAESDASESQVISGKSPSAVTLSRIENLSIATSTSVSGMASLSSSLKSPKLAGVWDNIQLPSEDNVAGRPVGDPCPVGDVTLPMALFALLIYFVYRGVTTSKRKNNL